MYRTIILVSVAIISLHLVRATVSEEADGQFEIRDGNCSNVTMSDLVFQDHIHLTRLPFTSRSAKSSWHGNEKIICIMALSQKEQSKGSTVYISEGGLNQHFITLQMKSATNHGLEYNIQIFGRL